MRFSDRETCKILELYRQCECLWNVNNENFRNRNVRRATWEAIAREMNIEDFTSAEAKSKIKTLHSTYRLELIKMKGLVKDGIHTYKTNLKWFSTMESIMKKKNNCGNPSIENGEHTPEGILPDDSQWEQQPQSSVEISSVNVSSTPSIPSESEIEKSVRSITDTEDIALSPEIQSVQSLSNSGIYLVGSECEVQGDQSIPNSQTLTVTPEILNIKAASKNEFIPVTSETKFVKSVSNSDTITVTSENQRTVNSVSGPTVTTLASGIQTVNSFSGPTVTTLASGIQTVNSASTPTFFALIPEMQTSKSISNPRFVTVSAANNQNVRYVSGSSGISLPPEIQQRCNLSSVNETPVHRKRRLEENSIDSNTDVHQFKNTRTDGDFSDRCEDEMDAFGHFVALNLRKMSMQSALFAQTEILSVLTRHRLNDSAPNPPSKQTFPYIVTNGNSSSQNPVLLQKVFLKS